MPSSNNIQIKKKYGQHFLRDHRVVHSIVDRISIDSHSSIFEIGCGDGFLTEEILKTDVARLWVFEIDPDWVSYVKNKFSYDTRLTVFHANILDTDFVQFEEHKPWVLLANLPYQVTFPILYLLQKHRYVLAEGVVMVQEEVALKIVKKGGRGYGFPSLFLQYYFDWELMDKIAPSAFYPPPKVFSRLLYFKPKANVPVIPEEKEFWKFIKICFHQPRRTLKNNLAQTHFDMTKISEDVLALRAQQMNITDFLTLWETLRS